uniref:Uncharacterized protein n=1 Tax=Romanomermis culicivorax TaxID=13658 RepID=A0A915IVP4_ROMCU
MLIIPEARQSGAETATILPSNQVTNGGISIPQNIVIPAQPGRTTPQRYQISSEVTISYNSSDKSAESSRANSRQAPQQLKGK